VVDLDLSAWGGSALTEATSPAGSDALGRLAYVPARNIIFLSVALGIAEARDLDRVYLGAGSQDAHRASRILLGERRRPPHAAVNSQLRKSSL
jgi:7-cyano-7-deazaguanine synthase in queuosine biosynthesis